MEQKIASLGLKCGQSSLVGMEGWVCSGAGMLQLVFSPHIIWGAFGGGFTLKSPS